jgi:hypothetical protein
LNTYRLVYSDDGIGMARTIEFEANDPAAALIIADCAAANRSVEIWREREILCKIRRSITGFWAVE